MVLSQLKWHHIYFAVYKFSDQKFRAYTHLEAYRKSVSSYRLQMH